MIKLSHVSKTYANQAKALQDVSFEISSGQVVYLLGESGSGKSTLVKIIAGLEDASHGDVWVDDEKITGPTHHLVPGYDEIAYMSQDFKLQQFWSVRDNVGKKISYLPEDERNEKIERLLALCKLESYADQMPGELSGGQQQRIAIATAIADDPEVLVLDEPFSNLDYPLKAEVRKELMQMLKQLGMTVVLVSHDPNEALAVADLIVLLRKGQLEQVAPPEEMYRMPDSYYAASFLGPVNKLSINGTNQLVRPEQLVLTATGKYQGQIVSSVFMGMHYHLFLSTSISEKDVLIFSTDHLPVGQEVRFDSKTLS